MSLRSNIQITITQLPNDVYPSGREQKFILDFCNSIEIVSTWQNLTDTCKLKIPRNIYVDNGDGKTINFGSNPNRSGQNIYGGNGTKPLFMRGDSISVEMGYFYDNMNGGPETLEMNTIFTGYISKIKNRVPIEIECEDEMWKLKQLKAPNKLFPGNQYTVQQMLAELLNGDKNNFNGKYKIEDGTDFTIKTNIGDFRTQNETIAQILDRLRKDGGMYSYFRGNTLRCSGIAYYPQDRLLPDGTTTDQVFRFQENIITDELEYTRKEDLNIAVKAHAEFISNVGGSNSDGGAKTKRQRVEVLVGKNGVIPKELESSFHGDLITIPVLIPNNINDLNLNSKGIKATELSYITQKAIEYLPKFYYTGFRGPFTTFGQPRMKHGDGAIIEDNVLPERNGTYLIKQVTTTLDETAGFKQKLLLHLRIDQGYTIQQINAGI